MRRVCLCALWRSPVSRARASSERTLDTNATFASIHVQRASHSSRLAFPVSTPLFLDRAGELNEFKGRTRPPRPQDPPPGHGTHDVTRPSRPRQRQSPLPRYALPVWAPRPPCVALWAAPPGLLDCAQTARRTAYIDGRSERGARMYGYSQGARSAVLVGSARDPPPAFEIRCVPIYIV